MAEPPDEPTDSELAEPEPEEPEQQPQDEEPQEEEPQEQEPVVTEDTDETTGDPFEGWPAAESAVVIEDSPLDGASVEHVRGEVDVPDGYTVLEGTPLGNRRSVGVVVSRFNGGITNRMLASALEALVTAGVAQDAITVMPVPGAFELPIAAMALAKTRRYACIVATRRDRPRRHAALRLRRLRMRVRLAARRDRDRCSGRLRRPDRRQRRAGRGPYPQGGGSRPLGARDGRSLRAPAGECAVEATIPPAMSKVCAICGKKPSFGNHRSHSMVATKRRFDPNLQRVRVLLKGSPTRAYVCTRCLKGNKVQKAI